MREIKALEGVYLMTLVILDPGRFDPCPLPCAAQTQRCPAELKQPYPMQQSITATGASSTWLAVVAARSALV